MTLSSPSTQPAPTQTSMAARRAVEYFDDAPVMDADMSMTRERPSLLAYNYRSPWRNAALTPAAPMLHAKQQLRYSMSQLPSHNSNNNNQQQHSRESGNRNSRISLDYYTSDDDGSDHGRFSEDYDHRVTNELYGGEEESKEEELERLEEEDEDDVEMLEAPVEANVPLLEVDEEDPEQESDVILGDLTRLPRTTIIDEDGFLVDPRATLLANMAAMAADGDMGFLAGSRAGTVIKSGLLFKQGFYFMSGGWKVRFVELTSSKLTFFKGENGRKRGEIDLSTCSPKSIEIMPRDSVFDGSQATMWRFAIKTKGRRVLMSAYSEAEMKEWLRCLHVALAVQSAGAGRFTDLVVPNGTLLAGKGDGLMRASGSGLLR